MRLRILPFFLLCLSVACSSPDEGPADKPEDIDPDIPCNADHCGQSRFRHAIPSRDTVRIQFGDSARSSLHRTGTENRPLGGIGQVTLALEARSPNLSNTEDYVAEINGVVDGLFESFEALASGSPEQESELVHVWRQVSDDDASLDEILVVTAIDERSYVLDLVLAENNVDPEQGVSVIRGAVQLDDDEVKTEFEFVIDLAAASDRIEGLNLSGEILISAHPFAGGLREVWYDFDAVGAAGGQLQNSRTTYWILDYDSGALEFVSEEHEELATVFVRWDSSGGRYDHHVEWDSELYGVVDEIATNCWDDSGAELFDAAAVIDADLSYYGEIDGDELDCAFGPVDAHPNPGEDFGNLPGDGEWQELEFNSDPLGDCDEDPFAEGCAPLCEDEPFDPDCVPWCEDEPSDPECLWYCDWVDDPGFCF